MRYIKTKTINDWFIFTRNLSYYDILYIFSKIFYFFCLHRFVFTFCTLLFLFSSMKISEWFFTDSPVSWASLTFPSFSGRWSTWYEMIQRCNCSKKYSGEDFSFFFNQVSCLQQTLRFKFFEYWCEWNRNLRINFDGLAFKWCC